MHNHSITDFRAIGKTSQKPRIGNPWLKSKRPIKSTQYGCGKFHKTFLDKPAVLGHVPRRYGRYGLPLEIFEAELDRQPRPDAVLVTSGMTYWYPGPFEAIRSLVCP